MTDLGEIRVKVNAEGTEEAAEQMESIQQDEDGLVGQLDGAGMEADVGGAAAMGGAVGGAVGTIIQSMMGETLEGLLNLVKTIATMVMAIAGSVVGIASIVMSMEGMQDTLDAIIEVFKAFFVPFLKMALRLLMPVLRYMIKLLPEWYEFMDEVTPYLGDMAKGLVGAWETAKDIWNAIMGVGTMIKSLIAKMIETITKLPMLIAEKIGSLGSKMLSFQTGGIVPRTGPAMVHRGEAVLPRQDFRLLLNELRRQRAPAIKLEGGLDALVTRMELDPNLRGG